MNNERDIFERMKDGSEIRMDDPQYFKVLEVVTRTLRLSIQLNTSGDVNKIRETLSEITGVEIDPSTTIFAPFHTNFGQFIRMGKNVFINHACSCLDMGGITIEDDVLIGPKVNLITENHPIDPSNRKTLVCKPIVIKRNAWIGAASTVLPGVTIGENAIVAAGSLVTKDVPKNTIVAGVPAKHLKNIS
jgi:acetyltransferase-like isoleucine patch superfamily enzyme